MNDKIYCGSGKAFGQYGGVNLGICLDDIPREFFKKAQNGKTYLNLVLNQKREIDNYGNTHSIEVSQFVPQQNQQNNQQSTYQAYQQPEQQHQPPQREQARYAPQDRPQEKYNKNGGSTLDNTVMPPNEPTNQQDTIDEIPFN